MAVMARRLQLLLDDERYRLVSEEAERTGNSVAAVIRGAIDVRFESEAVLVRRSAAASRLLMMTEPPDPGPAQTWEEIKADILSDLDATGGQKTRG